MDLFNSKFILKENRSLWIDYDKGISIILVGYGHCYGTLIDHGISLDSHPGIVYLGLFLYGFRMPLFFIISGMLIGRSLARKGHFAYIENRANNILYPLLIWGAIEITLQIVMAQFNHSGFHRMDYFNLLFNPRKTGHFWYLNALFCIGVMYALLKTWFKLNSVTQLALGLILYCVSAYIHIYDLKAGFLTDVLEYYFFFSLGDFISKTLLTERNTERFSSWKVMLVMLPIFLIMQYYCTEIYYQHTDIGPRFIERKLPFLYLIQALIGCTISVNFSFMMQKYRKLTFLRVIGYHSLFIYCMQIIVMRAATVACMKMNITNVPALVTLVWVGGTILPIFFYNICLKYNLWWLYTYKKPRRQVAYLQNPSKLAYEMDRKMEYVPPMNMHSNQLSDS